MPDPYDKDSDDLYPKPYWVKNLEQDMNGLKDDEHYPRSLNAPSEVLELEDEAA